jgi:hypothetical protein
VKTLPFLTTEDMHIWTRPKQYAYNGSFFLSQHQDRRDADLMSRLQQTRKVCDQQGVLHAILADAHTALPLWDDPDVSLNETGLAMRIPKLPERYR